MLLDSVLLFVLSQPWAAACPKHIPLPVIECQDLSKYGLHANGVYYHGSKMLIIDSHVCGKESYSAFLAHEMTHYVQEECGLPYDENQAIDVQHQIKRRET